MNLKSERIFITGIPTSGKSYLAKKLAERIGAKVIHLDDLRESLSTNETYKKWTNFYLDQDEESYLIKTTPEQKWQDLVNQSEGVWPAFKEEIAKYQNETHPVIFECVNLLPYIIKANSPDAVGIVLIGKSFEETFERNKKDPRWGDTEKLQELEAKDFFEVERPKYKAEAEKYNYPVFESADEAFDYLVKNI